MRGGARLFVAALLFALLPFLAGLAHAAGGIEQRVAACIACHGRAGAASGG